VVLSCGRAEKVKRAVEWIKTQTPPDSGNFCRKYAETARAAFDEIKALREEGIGLLAIAKGFESEGMLPQNPDPSTLGRALKREERKRARMASAKWAPNAGNEMESGSDATKPLAAKLLPCGSAQKGVKRELFSPELENGKGSKTLSIPAKTGIHKTGLQINPDNTFTIRPIDPDDLPDI
jgi:hypothetical protein